MPKKMGIKKETEKKEEKKLKSENNKSNLLSYEETPDWLKASYLLTHGYRPPTRSCCACASTAFSWHNETLNIWTHGLPIIINAYFCFYFLLELNTIHNHKNGNLLEFS